MRGEGKGKLTLFLMRWNWYKTLQAQSLLITIFPNSFLLLKPYIQPSFVPKLQFYTFKLLFRPRINYPSQFLLACMFVFGNLSEWWRLEFLDEGESERPREEKENEEEMLSLIFCSLIWLYIIEIFFLSMVFYNISLNLLITL